MPAQSKKENLYFYLPPKMWFMIPTGSVVSPNILFCYARALKSYFYNSCDVNFLVLFDPYRDQEYPYQPIYLQQPRFIYQLSYRVFIKYCVFSLNFCDFSELCQFCCTAGFLPAWCVYTH